MLEVYKITLKLEIDYHNTIVYEGKDLAILSSIVTLVQNKLTKTETKEND